MLNFWLTSEANDENGWCEQLERCHDDAASTDHDANHDCQFDTWRVSRNFDKRNNNGCEHETWALELRKNLGKKKMCLKFFSIRSAGGERTVRCGRRSARDWRAPGAGGARFVSARDGRDARAVWQRRRFFGASRSSPGARRRKAARVATCCAVSSATHSNRIFKIKTTSKVDFSCCQSIKVTLLSEARYKEFSIFQ